jgi:hypothetical protein
MIGRRGRGSAMLCDAYRGRAAGLLALLRVALVIAGCGLMAAGCTTSGQPVLDLSAISAPGFSAPMFGGPGPRTVAFESIDGPPEAVFRKLVAQLGQEAAARQLAMVSREQPAQYRIRGYVAAHVQGQRTTITWVWDVFTADRERAVRLTGEVPGAPSERAWGAADDAVVARIAQDGMNRLSAFLTAPVPVAFLPTAPEAPLAFLPSSRP